MRRLFIPFILVTGVFISAASAESLRADSKKEAAQIVKEESARAHNTMQLRKAQDAAAQQLLQVRQQLREAEAAAVRDMASNISRALGANMAVAQGAEAAVMDFADRLRSLTIERAIGNVLSDYLYRQLNDIHLRSVLGHRNVADQGVDPVPNIYLQGRLPAIADVFQAHVDLFCNPDAPNVPKACGAASEDQEYAGTENFIDFFTAEKTWPRRIVLEAMKLGRAYFGYIPDLDDLGRLREGSEDFLGKQAVIAQSNLRMNMINYLAAQRAPTNSSTYPVLMTVLSGLTPSRTVASVNYMQICAREKKSPQEEYVCSFTNEPEQKGGPRIISEKAIKRVLQFDMLLSPEFYHDINSSYYTAKGPIDRLEVFMLAQRLTQDYEELRMLQMQAASTAVSLMRAPRQSPGFFAAE